MTEFVIYHNPRCSKSRAALERLTQRGIVPNVIEYLKTPLEESEIRHLLAKLRLPPQAIIRDKEYAALNLAPTTDPDELIARIVQNPSVLQRPIVVCGDNARVCRPPELVDEMLT